jgi:hypothetical protein
MGGGSYIMRSFMIFTPHKYYSIKPKRMRQAEYVARMGRTRNTSMVLVRSLNEKDHEEELCVHRARLKWTLNKQDRRAWTGFGCLTKQTHGEMSVTTNPATHSPDRNIP